jgi:hypothetical protein
MTEKNFYLFIGLFLFLGLFFFFVEANDSIMEEKYALVSGDNTTLLDFTISGVRSGADLKVMLGDSELSIRKR